MYKDYFHFKDMPFSIAPDPRFLYMSAQHRDALAHLLYGVQGDGGFVLLTGEVGTGKTTLCRCLLEQIDGTCEVAYILNPKMTTVEMLAAVCEEFHLAVASFAASTKAYVDALNAHLLRLHEQSRRAVLIIDEAQDLDPDVLEQLRLLTNLETSTRKLLQIILIGQPELQETLRRPEMRQVAQRIVARYHLDHLSPAETAAFVAHRLSVAGSIAPLFPRSVVQMIHSRTGGVPRLINLLCDRALLGTFAQDTLQVDRATLRKAAHEVFGRDAAPAATRSVRWRAPLLSALAAGGMVAGVALLAASWQFKWPDVKPFASIAAAVAPVAKPSPRPAEPAILPPKKASSPSVATSTPLADLRWPDDLAPRQRSEELAFRELFKRYGIEYPADSGGNPCNTAERMNMQCLAARGGFADLQRFNQPAVLALGEASAADRFYALLVELTADSATLVLAGKTYRVTRAALVPLWSGNYRVLWKRPPGYNGVLAEGARGESVTWLRGSLASVQGGEAGGTPVFDAELARRVKQFQLAEGITPDGVAGELTLSLLGIRLDKNTPHLGTTASGT